MNPTRALFDSPAYLALPWETRYVAGLLWCGPLTPPWGIFAISRQKITKMTWMGAALNGRIEQVIQSGLIAWDEPTGLMWARGRCRVAPPSYQEGWNAVDAVHGLATKLGGGAPLFFIDAMRELKAAHRHYGDRIAERDWPGDYAINPDKPKPAQTRFEIETGRAAREAAIENMTASKSDIIIDAVDRWNDMARGNGLAEVPFLTAKLRESLIDTLQEIGVTNWKLLCDAVAGSDFLCGRNGGWRVSLDWLLKKQNWEKVRNGKYANKRPNARPADTHVRDIASGLAAALGRRRALDAGGSAAGGGDAGGDRGGDQASAA